MANNIQCNILISETILVVFIFIFRFLEKKIQNGFIRKNKLKNLRTSIWLNEFFLILKLCQYIFTIHLVIIVVYKYFITYHTPELTRFLFLQVNLILVLLLIIYECIRLYILQAEKWLPIVSENGNVIGKIAHSTIMSSPRQFIHPVVRIALIHNNLLYLSKRSSDNKIESNMLDFPFESFVKYGQTLEEAVNQLLEKKAELNNLSGKFVFKHICKKSSKHHKLFYLYIVQISSSQQAEAVNFEGGRWWTEKQIEESLNKGIFFEYFEMEYEIFKNTILSVNRKIYDSLKEKEE